MKTLTPSTARLLVEALKQAAPFIGYPAYVPDIKNLVDKAITAAERELEGE